MNEYSGKTCKELINMCKERAITGYSRKKKDELIELLSNLSIASTPTSLPLVSVHDTYDKLKHIE